MRHTVNKSLLFIVSLSFYLLLKGNNSARSIGWKMCPYKIMGLHVSYHIGLSNILTFIPLWHYLQILFKPKWWTLPCSASPHRPIEVSGPDMRVGHLALRCRAAGVHSWISRCVSSGRCWWCYRPLPIPAAAASRPPSASCRRRGAAPASSGIKRFNHLIVLSRFNKPPLWLPRRWGFHYS